VNIDGEVWIRFGNNLAEILQEGKLQTNFLDDDEGRKRDCICHAL
jgi:hypothetical protein